VDTTNMPYAATSNIYVSKFIDIDGNTSTWNSSSSYITLPDTYQQNGGKGILWAGMVWQGRFAWGNRTEDLHYYTEGTSSPIVHETGDNTGVNSVTLTQTNANKIRLKIDKGNYNQVTAYKVHSYTSSDGITYSAIADVTSLLQNANLAPGKHTFTVPNLPTEEGREWSPGIYGGWSLVVIYAEDPFVGKPRNITIYGGMGHLVSKDSATPIEISGFKLPSSGNSVTASLAIFSGEGEHDYTTDGVDIGLSSAGPWTAIPETGNNTNVFDAVLSNVDRDPVSGHKNNLQNNNVGIDVDYFDISNIVTNFPRTTTSFYLRWWSNNDYIIPGMIAFSTELYRPSLCYDYTLDVGGIVIPSSDNQIKTSLNKYTSLPLTTRLTIRSNEADFVLHDVNITYGIADVNQTQYINDSVKIAPDGIHAYLPAANQTFYQRTDGFGLYIGEGAGPGQGGSIDEKQTIFVKFDNDLNQSQTIDTSFILRAQYTVDFGSGPVPQAMTFTAEDICNDRGGYFPAWGRFNTTSDQADQTTGKPYNLYTQVANRPFNAEVFSFEPSNTDSPLTVDTNIELEVINAGHFSRDVNLTCLNPDSNITVPVFVSFDNSNHTSSVGMNINKAIRNTAFRTWHIEKPDGSLLEHHCTDITDNDCFENIYTSEYTSDGNCTTACSTNIASGTDSCYKCLKTY
ncbi:MAG: hypothetical protein L3J47_12830, partial [Sulfurovum sp.]|nr:hypothetical protein [Sulfurovum sp.]